MHDKPGRLFTTSTSSSSYTNIQRNIFRDNVIIITWTVEHHSQHIQRLYLIIALHGLAIGHHIALVRSLLNTIARRINQSFKQVFVNPHWRLPLVHHDTEMFISSLPPSVTDSISSKESSNSSIYSSVISPLKTTILLHSPVLPAVFLMRHCLYSTNQPQQCHLPPPMSQQPYGYFCPRLQGFSMVAYSVNPVFLTGYVIICRQLKTSRQHSRLRFTQRAIVYHIGNHPSRSPIGTNRQIHLAPSFTRAPGTGFWSTTVPRGHPAHNTNPQWPAPAVFQPKPG